SMGPLGPAVSTLLFSCILLPETEVKFFLSSFLFILQKFMCYFSDILSCYLLPAVKIIDIFFVFDRYILYLKRIYLFHQADERGSRTRKTHRSPNAPTRSDRRR